MSENKSYKYVKSLNLLLIICGAKTLKLKSLKV